MIVRNEIQITDDHKIQVGDSSWDNGSDRSVRSAYYRDNNQFNYAGSAEVSTSDLVEMVRLAVETNHFHTSELDSLNSIMEKTKIPN
jgi:hypothetical protein